MQQLSPIMKKDIIPNWLQVRPIAEKLKREENVQSSVGVIGRRLIEPFINLSGSISNHSGNSPGCSCS